MKFTKLHGCGNGYIYVNLFEEKLENPELNLDYDVIGPRICDLQKEADKYLDKCIN